MDLLLGPAIRSLEVAIHGSKDYTNPVNLQAMKLAGMEDRGNAEARLGAPPQGIDGQ
jgi:hypothetical protein